jgi:hypothetical protein
MEFLSSSSGTPAGMEICSLGTSRQSGSLKPLQATSRAVMNVLIHRGIVRGHRIGTISVTSYLRTLRLRSSSLICLFFDYNTGRVKEVGRRPIMKRPGFRPWPVHVGFVMDELALEERFLRELGIFPVI